MNKSELLTRIRNLQREVDSLIDIVIAMEDTRPEQPVQTQQVANDCWMTVKQVCEFLNISQTTFYEGIKNGLLPPGFAFGPKTKRWRISDIRAWQESKKTHYEEVPAQRKRRGRASRIRKIGAFIHV